MTALTKEEGRSSPQALQKLHFGMVQGHVPALPLRAGTELISAQPCSSISVGFPQEHLSAVVLDTCTPPIKKQINKHSWSTSEILGFRRYFALNNIFWFKNQSWFGFKSVLPVFVLFQCCLCRQSYPQKTYSEKHLNETYVNKASFEAYYRITLYLFLKLSNITYPLQF